MEGELRKRATAVILESGNLLLIRRVKPGQEYFIFPGGGVEEGETIENALGREVKEELNLDIKQHKFLFSMDNSKIPQNESYFLVETHDGVPEIGGPEKERMSDENQYYPEWVPLTALRQMKNIYPKEGATKLLQFLGTQK